MVSHSAGNSLPDFLPVKDALGMTNGKKNGAKVKGGPENRIIQNWESSSIIHDSISWDLGRDC